MSRTTVVPRGVKIFLLNHGQVKHLMSIFVPSTNKVHKQLHHCTVSSC